VFWDHRYTDQQLRSPGPGDWHYPSLVAALEHFGGDVTNRRLLDLGCGLGEASLFFADRGATVVSVDTSDVAISALRAYCMDHGISNVTPMRKPAEAIANIGPFDFVYGSLVLHHIEPFDEFVLALRAALPRGKAFFWENNARSSLLMWARNHLVGKLWVPKFGDKEESPLTLSEVKTLTQLFHVAVVYPEFYFFRLISQYLTRGRGESTFKQLDDLTYKMMPRFRHHSYYQYLLLS